MWLASQEAVAAQLGVDPRAAAARVVEILERGIAEPSPITMPPRFLSNGRQRSDARASVRPNPAIATRENASAPPASAHFTRPRRIWSRAWPSA